MANKIKIFKDSQQNTWLQNFRIARVKNFPEYKTIPYTKEKESEEHQNKRKETIKGAREKAVAAFKEYFMLIAGTKVSEDIIRSAFADIEESLEALNSIKITYNGKPFSIFEL